MPPDREPRQVAVFAWSGLGDALMALPLLQGLRADGREVFLIGKDAAAPFYSFLKDAGVVSGFRTYARRSGAGLLSELSGWAAAFRGWDLTLLPPRGSIRAVDQVWRRQPQMAALSLGAPVLLPALGLCLGTRFEFVPDAPTAPGAREPNRPLAYVQALKRRFGLDFKDGYLSFPPEVLARAEAAARPVLAEAGVEPKSYAAIYYAPQDGGRDWPQGLLTRILEALGGLGLRAVLVGSAQHGEPLPERPATPVTDLRGRREFLDLSGIFHGAKLAVCADGGLLHLALASKTPCLSLWGPTTPEERVLPGRRGHAALCRKNAARPRYPKAPTPQERAALFDFSRGEISAAIKELLESPEFPGTIRI